METYNNPQKIWFVYFSTSAFLLTDGIIREFVYVFECKILFCANVNSVRRMFFKNMCSVFAMGINVLVRNLGFRQYLSIVWCARFDTTVMYGLLCYTVIYLLCTWGWGYRIRWICLGDLHAMWTVASSTEAEQVCE